VTGKREAELEGLDDRMRLEWVHDSAFRFFPTQKDELFGYVLHPVDLATNKASAAADRREPRDIVDLLTIHKTYSSARSRDMRRSWAISRAIPGRNALRYHKTQPVYGGGISRTGDGTYQTFTGASEA
jgi:hypothetical protein